MAENVYTDMVQPRRLSTFHLEQDAEQYSSTAEY